MLKNKKYTFKYIKKQIQSYQIFIIKMKNINKILIYTVWAV